MKGKRMIKGMHGLFYTPNARKFVNSYATSSVSCTMTWVRDG
jgi:hypothetical protein